MDDLFRKSANKISKLAGTSLSFFLAITLIVGWLLTGNYFDYSDTWQLFINTCTTVITFLMVFLIQNTQNRDTKAMQIKLDELLRSTRSARNTLIDIENLSDNELEVLRKEFELLHNKALNELEKRVGNYALYSKIKITNVNIFFNR